MKTPSIFTSFILSLFLHSAFVGTGAFFYYHKPTRVQKTERLIVQIDGIMSEKQVEEKVAKEETPPPKPIIKQPKPKLKPIEEKPDIVEKVEEVSEEQPESAEPEMSSDIDQQAQSTNEEIDDSKELNKYLSSLKKQISKFISYPQKARDMGHVGAATVGFSVLADGSVEGVRIVKSTNYRALDESAVETVRKAAPFDRPPHALADISVEIYFKKE